jgi:excisionase family DNA binding protein
MGKFNDEGLGAMPQARQPIERGDVQVDKHTVDLETTTLERKMLCSVHDVAAMLSIGRTAAWELVRNHTIRSVKIGRTRRVPITAVQEYVERLLDEGAA